MVGTTALYGIFVTALGIIGYFASGQESKTALIPCVFGLPVLALAVTAWLKPKLTKHTMLAAAIIAGLAFLGTLRGFGGAITLLTGGAVERPAAVIAQVVMALISLLYVVMYLLRWRQAQNQRIS